MAVSRHIVNSAYLRKYINQDVSLMGLVKKVDSSGRSLTALSTDGVDVHVILLEPISQPVEGWVELIGQPNSKDTLTCKEIILAPSDQTNEEFDKDSHNALIQFLENATDPYKMSE